MGHLGVRPFPRTLDSLGFVSTEPAKLSVRPGSFRVGEWTVEPALNAVRREGAVVHLEPKVMDLLVFLARHAGQVVSREALFDAVWPSVVVTDDTLTQAVIKLRRAFGERARNAAYLQTVPKKGYRLIAAVTMEGESVSPSGRSENLRSGGSGRPGQVVIAFSSILLAVVLLWIFIEPERLAERSTPKMAVSGVGGERPTVSVLPFVAMGDPDDEAHLAQGLTLDLVTDLATLSGLWVIGSRSILGQSGERPERVDARYRVSGDIQRTGGQLRIHVRLFDTQTHRQLWAERYHRPFQDLFTVQEKMSRQIAAALSVKVSEAELRSLAHRYTHSLGAYEAFLRGQALLLIREASANERARERYRQAIVLDPVFGRAYAGLALTYAADYRNQWVHNGSNALEKAREMSRSALQIDPDIPEVYWVLAYVHAQQRDHLRALELLAKATSLDRSFADAYALMGGINTYIGNPEATVDLLRTATRLKPDAGYLYFLLLGRAYFFTGDWDQANINLREALARNPANLETHVYLAVTAESSGDHDGAVWETEEIRSLEPGFSVRAWLDTYPMADSAQRKRLISALERLGL